MKRLLAALLLLSLGSAAQQLPTGKNGRITFSEQVEVPGVSKQLLKDKAVKIISEAFSPIPGLAIKQGPDSVLFKGFAFYNLNKIGVELPYFFNFTLTITVEEGKYRYVTTDFVDDENIPLEKGLLKPSDIYDANGEVKQTSRETFDAVVSGIKKVGQRFKANMDAALSRTLK
ncbi:MAG TPA: hypothetical protein VF487_09675 [Chitinophagaceae bacterium]